MQWYYLVQGQRQGPVDDGALELLVRQGIVQDDTLVWRDGLVDWQAYGAVKPRPAPAPRPEPVQSRPEPPQLRTEPFQSKPEPVQSKPEPAQSKPEPALSPTESFQVRPEPPLSRPEPVQLRPEPVQLRPEPVQLRPEPVQLRPEPVQSKPEPVQSKPEPPLSRPEAPLPHVPPPGAPAMAGKGSRGVFFFYPVLEALSDGRIIRKSVIVVLKVLAVLIALGGILAALTVLTTALRGTGGMALGGILFAILLLGTAACVGQIYWYRAGSVAALEHSKNTVIPIFAILSRAGGEAAATGLGGVGLGACLFLWLSPEGAGGALQAVPFMAQIPAEGGFLTGILVLVYLALLGFSALIFGYLWAECIMLLVDIERNTRKSV